MIEKQPLKYTMSMNLPQQNKAMCEKLTANIIPGGENWKISF